MKNLGVINSLLDGYLALPQPETVDAPVEQEQPAVKAKAESIGCCLPHCKRKGVSNCEFKLCFTHCYELNKFQCAEHYKKNIKKEAEEKLIEVGLRVEAGSRQKTTFYHYEEKFMRCGETIVLWCLQDFLRRKAWSADTMEHYRRLQRTQALNKRRRENIGASQKDRSKGGPLEEKRIGSAGTQSRCGGSSTDVGLKRARSEGSEGSEDIGGKEVGESTPRASRYQRLLDKWEAAIPAADKSRWAAITE